MNNKTYKHIPTGKDYKVNGAGGLIPVDGSTNVSLPLWLRDNSKDWIEVTPDNVLTFPDTPEVNAFKDYLNKEFNRILYSNWNEHGKQYSKPVVDKPFNGFYKELHS